MTTETPNPKLLADATTSRVGGLARDWAVVETDEALIEALRRADTAHEGVGEPVLILGGGSNLLVADEGFPGTVVQIRTRGRQLVAETEANVTLRVAAGENWDELVAATVEQGWAGLEALSGIPGLVGATPVQNVGAYGADVAQTISGVRVYERSTGTVRQLAPEELNFGYRSSTIKTGINAAAERTGFPSPDWIVLSVDFTLERASGQENTAPVRYGQLARALGVELGERVELARVREAVLKLRAGKGMVLDPTDHDTWSTGSFFTNPIVPVEQAATLPEDAPQFPAGTDPETDAELVKLSAAWLIDHAGFHKGFGAELTEGRASLSTKHTLALTNRGQAATEDLLSVARAVRDGVREHWGIELVPEPFLIGCRL